MRIKTLNISGVGGIDHLDLVFDERMNVICGPNGIGKTTILECIAHVFSAGETNILKRNVKSDRSEINASIDIDQKERLVSLTLREFAPSKKDHVQGAAEYSDKLLSLKINRTFEYSPLEAVRKDTEKPSHVTYSEARNGVIFGDVKNWFVNRYLYSAHNSLTAAQKSNFELARKSFSVLNSDYKFSKVDASTNEIMVNSPGGEIYYEYLSSGFKSCLSIIFGIIKEIEYRFSDKKMNAEDFDGIVIIDEVELHLHPDWQARILSVLLGIFPKVQFICSTHSPHVIQAADADQIIAIEAFNGSTSRRKSPVSSYGFKGWTIEEVLTDVMGMEDLHTDEYSDAVRKFEDALDRDDRNCAETEFSILDKMLHPTSHLRKMFKLQMAAIPENAVD